jgi:hypothetical protein
VIRREIQCSLRQRYPASDVWGILPLRFGSELTAQKVEIWRLWGLSEEFGSVGDNSSALYRVTITGWVPLETCQDPAQWGTAIGKFLSNLKPEDQMEDSDKFMAILIPDQIEKELDRSDRIDEN